MTGQTLQVPTMPSESPTLVAAGVSAREAEVLDLLAEHLTNAEISARLFISVRTVESHVSSLLRKLAVADRRALGQFAADLAQAGPPTAGDGDAVLADDRAPGATAAGGRPGPLLPAPLTSFVGRQAERAALAQALDGQRLVTAVGPGGVGKTRLALAVASDLADRYEDGVWYVDLVPVTEPAMIPGTIATALGLTDRSGRSITDIVLTQLATQEALVVLDNCEHLVDSVVLFVERLLAACPRITVLATSRARLLVPFERVFPVAGLDTSPAGDAVALFVERAAAVGASPFSGADLRRVSAICAQLDGMALAIELAAARLPTLGLDGLEAGLANQLQVLAGRPRLDDRHSSLRAALDWSYALLSPTDRAVLRRIAVFAAPFRADDAIAVATDDDATGADGTGDPVGRAEVATALAHLADQSLLVVVPDSAATRYRALETIRQYGLAEAADVGELDHLHTRHRRWALAEAEELQKVADRHPPAELTGQWRAAFDHLADDLRAALISADRPEHRADAHRTALTLANLALVRGLSGESQRRFEEAADLVSDHDPRQAATALLQAAGIANIRQLGDVSLRLRRAAARKALAAGDTAIAASALAGAALLVTRFPGILAEVPSEAETVELHREAQRLALVSPPDPRLDIQLLTLEAFEAHERDPLTAVLADRAVQVGRRLGDPWLLSAALDSLTLVELSTGDTAAAAATARQRAEMVLRLPVSAATVPELPDALQMAAEAAIAVGDLAGARGFAEQVLALPIFGEEEVYHATSRLLVVEALAGNWDRVLAFSRFFRKEWERAGQPPTSHLAMGAGAVAMVHGLRGDDAAREDWLLIVAALRTALVKRYNAVAHTNQAFDAIVMLHRGETADAAALLAEPPESLRDWHSGRTREWYAALWAETSVLRHEPDVARRLERAQAVTFGNPIAVALVDRAAALQADTPDPALLGAIADRLDAAGCHYQAARTRVFAGGEARREGEAQLATIGAAPMAI